VIGLGLAGLVAGGFLGGYLVPKGAGLAGGAMVFWYAVSGAIVVAGFGVIAGFRLNPDALRWAALGVSGLVLAGFLALIGTMMLRDTPDRGSGNANRGGGVVTAPVARPEAASPVASQ